ncbi:Asp/Glu racemase [Elioraea sp. Yellowstone]|uniref:aspartate/glutamate racemase family protein n=1 Tax=Elioraea sp. Yellowstone TaxID=2592070 RepID=UPI001152F383|nr:aspartate/glutamate racemase family protein [Elioraea sp. Yellowstone]TQF80667.1 Asp/Glu racemase [Elioraea sp. Yellowstone]
MTRRILFINPNSNARCGEGIARALDPFRAPGLPAFDVVTLPDGPPAIVSWSDWYAATGPILATIRREDDRTDLFAIACASDPALPAAREATRRPVIGIFAAAVAQALTLAERFGVIALATASIARHALALRQMGTEARLAAEIAMDVDMDTLLDPQATRAAMQRTARDLVARGARTVILGCAGMAHHRAAVEDAAGVPVIEPCQAAAGAALSVLLAGGAAPRAPRQGP